MIKERKPRARRPKPKPSLVRMEAMKTRILARSSVFIVMNLNIMLQNVQTRNPASMLQS